MSKFEGGYNMVAVTGPTACGKTALAVAIADRLSGEVISADSRQVYRGMDIGTGKDLCEYKVNGRNIPFHLIDIVDAGYKYNVFEYQKDFVRVWNDMQNRGVFPVLCGGSGLYVESVVKGYRMLAVPENIALREGLDKLSLEELTEKLSSYGNMHNTTDVDTKKRAIRAIEIEEYYASHTLEVTEFPPVKPLIIGVDISRDMRRSRITERLKQRLNEGMVDEIKNILKSGVTAADLCYYGLEYKYVTQYVIGEISQTEMFDSLNVAIHQFAKRQMTWFRKMERDGFTINWLPYSMPLDEKVDGVVSLLENGQ